MGDRASLLNQLESEMVKYADDPRLLKHVTKIRDRIVQTRIAERQKLKSHLKKRKAQKQARKRSR